MTDVGIKLSICIPTYRRGSMLKELLEYIISQIDENSKNQVEIVVSSNPSEGDNTFALIQPLIDAHSNIHYYKNVTNTGFLNTVTIAQYAAGEYILMLSDDDVITPYALNQILLYIDQQPFDILFHKPIFSEHPYNISSNQKEGYKKFIGIIQFITYLYGAHKGYSDLISFFSFYSCKIAKRHYLLDAYKNVNKSVLSQNSFPHEFINFYSLTDKVILYPATTLVVGRLLNESYPGKYKLIGNLREVINYIESKNYLQNLKEWKRIKKIILRGWATTIIMGILINKLGIKYKQNKVLKNSIFSIKKIFNK